MRIVQIGNAGHAEYAYPAIRRHGLEFTGLACGSHGIDKEGTTDTLAALQAQGLSPKLYGSYSEMLSKEKPDIAIVNPWFHETGAIALEAMQRGIHVFCEKPIATDLQTLQKLQDCVRQGDAVLAGMFGSRYLSEFVTAKKAVRDGKIGTVRMMDSRKSYKLGNRGELYRSRSTYCGILPWVGIHAIDWMAWLSGEQYIAVDAYHACSHNGGNGDMDITASAQFYMTNDVIATLTADMYRPASALTHGDDRVRIVGTEGVLEVARGRVMLIKDPAGETELPPEPPQDIFEDMLLLLAGKPVELTAEAAIEATRWALAADSAADAKRFDALRHPF